MPVKPNFDPTNLYFITTTAVHHKHLFRRDVNKRIIVDSLSYMRPKKWLNLYAFVVMPNHIHIMVRFQSSYTLSDVMREFKKHTSKQIIRQYQADNNQRALDFLVQAAENIRDQAYKVWEIGYDARDVYSVEFLRSSARFYLLGEPTIIVVDNVSHLMI